VDQIERWLAAVPNSPKSGKYVNGLLRAMIFRAIAAFVTLPGLIAFAIPIAIVADLEGLAISLVLRTWQSDVPSLFHALRIRNAAIG